MSEKPDYRATVFLPKTDFPMKAGLAQKEPAILARWASEELYKRLRAAREGRERFILHDGPPYANGDLHMGHAMNKILKDIIVRSASLRGFDAPYIPGWDCHGLPIEWKVEEQYRKKKLDKDEVPVDQFRAECRAYAEKWVAVQSEQFQRLGVMGEWDDPYLTMKYEAEAKICEELLKFAESGQLYRGAKPVMWSPVEKTALAEAEVEYEDIVSTQIDVAFEITKAPNAPVVQAVLDKGDKVFAVIWTTTPWTIPVNQALAYGPEVEYVLVDSPLPNDSRKFVIAAPLVQSFLRRLPDPGAPGASALDRVATYAVWVRSLPFFMGKELADATADHPMHHLGGFFAKPRPFLPGDFVTTDAGTGLVHMAPDHGEDDFLLCKAQKPPIEPVFAVEDDGKYRNDWLWLGGLGSVINNKFNAPDGPICVGLREAGGLLAASADFQHSYPHSWRSKAKVIFRCTPQWFIPMDQPVASLEQGTLRKTALKAIADTRWVPEKAKNRINAMIEQRPDWVISRQRAWGVPIAVYVNRKTGEYLKDPAVNSRIIRAFHEGGADAWFAADHQGLLGNGYKLEDYEPQKDILDVWFDSGSTHAYVIEARYGEGVRADLYLEGSDQHRGWFHSSLLESSGTRGRAPYKGVLTHGFAMDGQGRKMSKSIGNVVDPLAIIRDNGADILRLWVASTDYFEDVRIGNEVLAGTSDAYRKLRNTFRYLLGALDGFSDAEKVAPAEMPELERWVLHRLAELDAELREASEGYEFNRYARALMAFANDDLSAFFFDIRKDSLYCDAPTDLKRRAYRTVLDTVFQALVRWVSPILCFTAEEVWETRFPGHGSVHLLEWPEIDAGWRNDALAAKMTLVRDMRSHAFELIEARRAMKEIGSGLEAEIGLGLGNQAELDLINSVDLSEIFLVARVSVKQTPSQDGSRSVEWLGLTQNGKCERCWRYLPEVKANNGLCDRCEGVVNG